MLALWEFFFGIWRGIPSSGLVHHWPLDTTNLSGSTVLDTVGTDNGTKAGGVTLAVGPTAAANTALTLGGAAGVSISLNTNALNWNTSSFTVAGWVWITNNNALDSGGISNQTYFMDDRDGVGTNYVRLYNRIAGGAGSLAMSVSGTTSVSSAGAVPSQTWTHIALTNSGGGGGGTLTVYVNSLPVSMTSLGAPPVDASFAMISSFLGDGNAINGELTGREARWVVYNRALSGAEIAQLYVTDLPTIGASAALTQANAALSAADSVIVGASAALTQADAALSAAAAVTVGASASLTQANAALSATAAVLVQASATLTQANASLSAAAGVTVGASAALTQANAALAATAGVTVGASAALTQANFALSADASVASSGINASAALTQADAALSAAAAGVTVGASAVLTQSNAVLSATMRTRASVQKDGDPDYWKLPWFQVEGSTFAERLRASTQIELPPDERAKAVEPRARSVSKKVRALAKIADALFLDDITDRLPSAQQATIARRASELIKQEMARQDEEEAIIALLLH